MPHEERRRSERFNLGVPLIVYQPDVGGTCPPPQLTSLQISSSK